MLALLVTSALGSTCSIVLSTREAYRPTSGDIDLGEPGGWRRETFSGLTPARRAQMELYKKEFKRLPAAIQDEIVKGELPDGLDEVAAVLAWGEPGYVWPSDRRCIGMLYGVDEGLPVALEACDGRIVERVQLLRTVPCTRLAQGVDRWDKKAKHFAEYTFLQQLDILAGHKGDWMDDKAFELAFGKEGRKMDGYAAIYAAEGVATAPVAVVPAPVAPVAVAPVPVVPAPVAPVPVAPVPVVPAPVAPAPVAPVPVAPVPAPVVRSTPVDVLSEAPIQGGTFRFSVTCGTVYDLELEIGGQYTARASSRDASGALVHRTTRGVAQGYDDRVKLLGLGVYTYATRTLALGPWPGPACVGVTAVARE